MVEIQRKHIEYSFTFKPNAVCLEYMEGKKRQLRSGDDTNCETLSLNINDVSD